MLELEHLAAAPRRVRRRRIAYDNVLAALLFDRLQKCLKMRPMTDRILGNKLTARPRATRAALGVSGTSVESTESIVAMSGFQPVTMSTAAVAPPSGKLPVSVLVWELVEVCWLVTTGTHESNLHPLNKLPGNRQFHAPEE